MILAWRRHRLRVMRGRLIEIEAKINYRADNTNGMAPNMWFNEAAEIKGKIARLESQVDPALTWSTDAR